MKVSNFILSILNNLDPHLKQLGEEKVQEWRNWFDSRLDNAIEVAENQENQQIESM